MPKIGLNNIELYYEEYGDGEGAIILLHGFLSSSRMWKNKYVPALMKKYKVYTIDVRGHGNSNNVKTGCNLQQMADDIYRFAILKKIDPFILAGMSMGGAIIIPKAVKIVMSNEGHAVVIENPEKVLSEINSFLKNTSVE